MKKLEIDREKLLEAYNSVSEKDKKILENILGIEIFTNDITSRIKTFSDVLTYLIANDVTDMDVFNYKMLEKLTPTPHILAYQQLVLIAKALNQGWKPNWNDHNEEKFVPWFFMGSSGRPFEFSDYDIWHTSSYVGSRLCFKSKELAEYAAKNFEKIYKNFNLI